MFIFELEHMFKCVYLSYMPLKHVRQEHICGCFVAAVATLLKVTYRTAFIRMFERWDENFDGIAPNTDIHVLMEKVGLDINPVDVTDFRKLAHDALLIVTWNDTPSVSHCVVWDAKSKKIVDPLYSSYTTGLGKHGHRVVKVVEVIGRQRKSDKQPTRRRSDTTPSTSSSRTGFLRSRRGT